jgi:hypothetical protein
MTNNTLGNMGEVSRNIIVVLALIVIAISALGTWTVMNAAMETLSGRQIPVSGDSTVAGGLVKVNVVEPQPPLAGRVSVMVGGVE